MLKAYPVPGKLKSLQLCEAFVRGAPERAQGSVFYGVVQANLREWMTARRGELPWYYIDNAYFDATRGQRFRVTKNALQIDASTRNSNGERFDALGLQVKPLRQVDGYWLAVEQTPGFDIVVNHRRWLLEAAYGLQGRPIIWRTWDRDKLKTLQSLPEAIEGAYGVLTHTSAAAVQAALMGVRCIVSEHHALSRMVFSTDPAVDQRRRCLSVLADYEFTVTELQDGTAWRRLTP